MNVTVLLKRIFKARMGENDLFTVAGHLITNLKWVDESMGDGMRTTLTSLKYPGGITYLDAWRDETKTLLMSVARENSWHLQKQKLIKCMIAFTSWFALYSYVHSDKEMDLVCWEDCVSGVDEFRKNDKSLWPHILAKTNSFALLMYAVFTVVGGACFGINDEIQHQIKVYGKLKQYDDEKRGSLIQGILDLNKTDPNLSSAIIKKVKEKLVPVWNQNSSLLDKMSDEISSGSIDLNKFETAWSDIAHRNNEALLTIQKEVGIKPAIVVE